MIDDPLHPHSHDPNPDPPSADPTIILTLPDSCGGQQAHPITPQHLQNLPEFSLDNCYIVSTGHGTSGPFTFTGPTLHTLIQEYAGQLTNYDNVEVISGDGFGTRAQKEELESPANPSRPILLALKIDGRPLTRQEGLVRLIVPTETDDALRQVKWIAQINICR